MLECRDKALTDVFSSGEMLYGGDFLPLARSSFAIGYGHWLDADPMCCPSHQRRVEYRWDREARTFVPVRTTFFELDPATGKATPVDPHPGRDWRNRR